MPSVSIGAESGIDSIDGIFGDHFHSSEHVVWAYLYAGYPNRFLDENTCQATMDGGEQQDDSIHFERVVQHFSEVAKIVQYIDNQHLYYAFIRHGFSSCSAGRLGGCCGRCIVSSRRLPI